MEIIVRRNRRKSIVVRIHEVELNGLRLIVGAGRHADGRLAEVFIDSARTGTAMATLLQDSAILLLFALQFGADPADIRRALSRTGPIAAVLDKITEDTP